MLCTVTLNGNSSFSRYRYRIPNTAQHLSIFFSVLSPRTPLIIPRNSMILLRVYSTDCYSTAVYILIGCTRFLPLTRHHSKIDSQKPYLKCDSCSLAITPQVYRKYNINAMQSYRCSSEMAFGHDKKEHDTGEFQTHHSRYAYRAVRNLWVCTYCISDHGQSCLGYRHTPESQGVPPHCPRFSPQVTSDPVYPVK